MNGINISKLIVFSFLFLFLSPVVYADGTATAITDQAGFYTVSYSFTTEDYALQVPQFTQRSDETENSSEVGYTFTSTEGGDTTAGKSAGVVFSDLQSNNGSYYVPPYTTASFTLFVILKLNENDPKAKYGLQVTNLPFTVIRDGNKSAQKLETLASYKTKQIGLNK